MLLDSFAACCIDFAAAELRNSLAAKWKTPNKAAWEQPICYWPRTSTRVAKKGSILKQREQPNVE